MNLSAAEPIDDAAPIPVHKRFVGRPMLESQAAQALF
jgi:hypothetical protein